MVRRVEDCDGMKVERNVDGDEETTMDEAKTQISCVRGRCTRLRQSPVPITYSSTEVIADSKHKAENTSIPE